MTILKQWAGHFQAGGSDKVWAAAYTTDGHFLSVWGRRGNALQGSAKTLAHQQAASKEFTTRVKKKRAEGYQSVPFDDPRYGIPTFGELCEDGATSSPDQSTSEQARLQPVYLASHVTPLSWSQLQACLHQETVGTTEKINGVRCLIACVGKMRLSPITAEGLQQHMLLLPPRYSSGWHASLSSMENSSKAKWEEITLRLTCLNGKDTMFAPGPIESVSKRLKKAMKRVGLITGGGATYTEAMERSLRPELTLLTPTTPDLQIIEAILARKGEGVIVRTLDAPYEGGDTRHIRKFKFLADLDAIVIGVNPGTSTGSIRLGLLRPLMVRSSRLAMCAAVSMIKQLDTLPPCLSRENSLSSRLSTYPSGRLG